MKITILGPAYPYRGGIAAFSERLAHELKSEGHEVDIVTFTLQYPSILFPGKTQYSNDSAPSDLKIRRLFSSINPFSWISTGRKIKKWAPDILIPTFWMPFMAPCLGVISRIARKNNKTKVVSILHNLIPHEKRPGDNLLIKYFCNSSDRFVALSQSVVDDISNFDKVKPRAFSPHPLYDNYGEPVSKDEACRYLGLDSSRKNLLFFGLIREYKGLDILLKAYAPIADKAALIVVGEFYSDPEKYHALAVKLGIDDKVIWHTEYVPDSDVKYCFCAADLIVQPYKSATQSGVTQIAYHFEKPMLVTNVGGLSEIVPNGKVGYAVDPNPESITEAICSFLDTEPDFSAGIMDEKKKYAWNKMVEAVLGSNLS